MIHTFTGLPRLSRRFKLIFFIGFVLILCLGMFVLPSFVSRTISSSIQVGRLTQVQRVAKMEKGLGENEVATADLFPEGQEFHTVPNPLGEPDIPSHEQPVSIILVNYQEPKLAPTVRDLLNTPGQQYINEVCIVDDMSTIPTNYSSLEPDHRIRILRAHSRLGLIRARHVGGTFCQGPFMVLLDAHVKPHNNWLDPIIRLLRENHKRILNMEVGLLDGNTWMQIEPGAIGSKAGFRWDLTHFWEPYYSKEQILAMSGIANADPDESPITMGMFATTKKWWKTIGGMDPELKVWGGENIEISLRTWMCGGEIRVARGAFVDHVFRNDHPYEFPGDAYLRNIVRVAEAWMDEPSKEKFYAAIHTKQGSVNFGSVEETHQLQRSLKCFPFSWYMQKFKQRSPIEKSP